MRDSHRYKRIWLCLALALLAPSGAVAAGSYKAVSPAHAALRNELAARFGQAVPRQWGETVTGVKTRLDTREKVIALTMDACGSDKGMRFDTGLLDFLEREQVAATLFINARWIGPNRVALTRLAANPLFEIANHGLRHKPASVKGRAAYGIAGTQDVAELVDEIALGAAQIEILTGRRPLFFRAGTAYYDEVAVQVANALGQEVAGFSILGDKGATYTRSEVRAALLSASAGDIIIVHMNHPEGATRAGIMDAIPLLRQQGFRFVRLSEYPLR